MELGDYLKAQMAQPWAWGSADCTTFAGDWVKACTGIDPMAKWRGYRSEADVELLMAEAGGLLALWGEGMLGIWPRVRCEPRPGYIGIITVIGEYGAATDIGAIFTGKRWAFRSPRGIGAVSAIHDDVVAIWGK